MKKVVLALSLLVGGPAVAADLAVKAPAYVATPCTAQSCSGWYAGFGITGDGTNADIIGGGLNNSLFQSGGAITVGGGYQLWQGALLAGVQVNAGYEFTNSAAQNAPTGNKFVGQELIKLGYNFFPSAIPAPTTPSQSPVVLSTASSILAASTPYLAFGGLQRNGVSEWVNGAGVQTVIAAGWSSEVEYLYAPSQQGQPATNIVSLRLLKHF